MIVSYYEILVLDIKYYCFFVFLNSVFSFFHYKTFVLYDKKKYYKKKYFK